MDIPLLSLCQFNAYEVKIFFKQAVEKNILKIIGKRIPSIQILQ